MFGKMLDSFLRAILCQSWRKQRERKDDNWYASNHGNHFSGPIQERRVKRFRFIFAWPLLAMVPPLAGEPSSSDRNLSFYHTHTSQSLTITYFEDGKYVDAALDELNRFLADFRTGDEIEMDPGVFDILYEIQRASGSTGTFEVISAYRSPATNEMLRGRSGGVARNSQHLLGKAIDVRLTDLDTAELRDIALSLGRGGVGYYQDSDFVHVDTGRVRQW
jgi:uncharacterized protein YcbK (DUF882 family)